MNELMSEFFDEVIAHIIPGLFAIFLFAHQLLNPILLSLNNNAFVFCFLLVLVAWAVGTTLDVVSIFIIHRVSLVFQCLFGWPTLKNKVEAHFPDEPKEMTKNINVARRLVDRIYPNEELRSRFFWHRCRQGFLESAKKLMFRNLMLIFCITTVPRFWEISLVFSPALYNSWPGICSLYPQPFPCNGCKVIEWQWWYGFLGAFICLAAYWWHGHPVFSEDRPADYENTPPPGKHPLRRRD